MERIVSGVGVLDKAVAILVALEVGPASLATLVERTGYSRATAHRLAVALEAHGLVRRDGEGRFALGLRLAALGSAATEALPLATLARPVMERLRDDTGESVQLFIRDGHQRVCVSALESPHGLRTIVEVGARLPMTAGSAGHVLAGGVLNGGWAASVGQREAGVASVSAPVHGPGGSLIAALSVSGPIGRTSTEPGPRDGADVVAAAASLTELISG